MVNYQMECTSVKILRLVAASLLNYRADIV